MLDDTSNSDSGTATESPPPAPATQASAPTPVEDDAQKRLLSLYEQAAIDSKREADRLRARLDELEASRQPPQKEESPVPTDNSEFWGPNSVENMTKLIDSRLQKAVEPLVKFVEQTKGSTEYDRIKNKLREDPNFKGDFAAAEPYIDEIMRKTPVNEQNVITTALSVIGGMKIGMIKSAIPNAPPKPNNSTPAPTMDSTHLPAHLRPSSPSAAPSTQQKSARELTEIEKRIARENRMTDAEYLSELAEDKPMVIPSLFPVKKEKK